MKSARPLLSAFVDRAAIESLALPLVLFLWVFLSAAYFCQCREDWNVASRMSLTYAIVEQGSFAIDDYRMLPEFPSGGDCAFYNGHYYSDKIIGTSLLGVPWLYIAKLVARLLGLPLPYIAGQYLVTLFTSGLFAALGAVAMFKLLLAFGRGARAAAVLTVGYAFGTMLAGYSSLFYSYAPAVFFALASYLILVSWRAQHASADGAPLFAAGLSLGMSLLCEYTIGLVAIGLSVYLLYHLHGKWRIAIYWFGAFIPLTVFMFYTLACFQELTMPYSHMQDQTFQEGMSRGFMGISRFRLPVLYFITIHPYRGLFFLSPFLALSPIGLFWMWRDRERRSDVALILFLLVGYLAFNSSYYMWWGGWTYGPRHMIPLLPFLIVPLAYLWRRDPVWRFLILGLMAVSIAIAMLAAAVGADFPQMFRQSVLVDPRFSDPYKSPLLTWGVRNLRSGQIQPNAGMLLGLKGSWSLLPLGALWGAMLAAMLWLCRKAERSTPDQLAEQRVGGDDTA